MKDEYVELGDEVQEEYDLDKEVKTLYQLEYRTTTNPESYVYYLKLSGLNQEKRIEFKIIKVKRFNLIKRLCLHFKYMYSKKFTLVKIV